MKYTHDQQIQLQRQTDQYLQLNAKYLPEKPAETVADLKNILAFHEYLYRELDAATLPDSQYDQLFDYLAFLEETYPDLLTTDSPTQKVGSDLASTGLFNSVQHLTPMLSLNKGYNGEELSDFDEQVKKFAKLDKELPIEYMVEPKFDGGTITLVYENDVLVRGATRGNGVAGDDITQNVKVIDGIPHQANFSKYGIKKVELRGEALIQKSVFEEVNAQRAADKNTLFANPRNAATGGLRSKDPQDVLDRRITAFIYQIGFASDKNGKDVLPSLQYHSKTIDILTDLGFKTPEESSKKCENITEVIDFCNHWQEKRDSYGYEIDGMVVKVNDLAIQEQIGYTSHHPRWAIAFKFKAKQAQTKLLSIDYQVGKVGAITPVAKLQPVQLAGVMVGSVSLHNEDFITSKDIRIGDTVVVERAGDVIPYIVRVVPELRDGSQKAVEYPQFCPANLQEQKPLVRVTGEAVWRCVGCTCGSQDFQKWVAHVSKNAMDIEGMSEATLERFRAEGWLRSLADIYRLDYEKVSKLEGFGKKSAENLKKSIEKAKKNPIKRFLYGLSIHHFGQKASKLLAAEIQHVLELKDWDLEHFTAIKDVGPVVAQNVMAWFSEQKNRDLLQEMESLGVNLTATDEDKKPETASEGIFAGKSILFTGAMGIKREEAEKLAAERGANIASGVSSKLSILVVGEKAGSKLDKAQKLGTVEIWSEQDFLEKIGV